MQLKPEYWTYRVCVLPCHILGLPTMMFLRVLYLQLINVCMVFAVHSFGSLTSPVGCPGRSMSYESFPSASCYIWYWLFSTPIVVSPTLGFPVLVWSSFWHPILALLSPVILRMRLAVLRNTRSGSVTIVAFFELVVVVFAQFSILVLLRLEWIGMIVSSSGYATCVCLTFLWFLT